MPVPVIAAVVGRLVASQVARVAASQVARRAAVQVGKAALSQGGRQAARTALGQGAKVAGRSAAKSKGWRYGIRFANVAAKRGARLAARHADTIDAARALWQMSHAARSGRDDEPAATRPRRRSRGPTPPPPPVEPPPIEGEAETPADPVVRPRAGARVASAAWRAGASLLGGLGGVAGTIRGGLGLGGGLLASASPVVGVGQRLGGAIRAGAAAPWRAGTHLIDAGAKPGGATGADIAGAIRAGSDSLRKVPVVGTIATFISKLAGAAKAADEFGTQVAESRRELAKYDGRVASATAQRDIGKIQNDVYRARQTGRTASWAVNSATMRDKEIAKLTTVAENIANTAAGISNTLIGWGAWFALATPFGRVIKQAESWFVGKPSEASGLGRAMAGVARDHDRLRPGGRRDKGFGG